MLSLFVHTQHLLLAGDVVTEAAVKRQKKTEGDVFNSERVHSNLYMHMY